MKTDLLIDALLDQWEDWVERNPNSPIDIFVANHCKDKSTNVVSLFLVKAKQLICINQRLNAVGATDESVSPDETERDLQINGLAPGLSPVSGYTLLSRLGGGGFGEVWKAVGPGDFLLALKFVPVDNNAGRIESRSLDVMRDIRHANLLSYFGSWTIGKLLIIATELADKTLLDRLQEEQSAGQQGISPDELLDYMSEAAKGIDFLNEPKLAGRLRIQHRDIKPQNLLLSGGSIKVGDFGLARAFQYDATGHTGSMTLAYAAPECFDGKTSYRSDQYSLAIAYCYLRSGRLPFNGTQFEIIEGHRSKPPDLSMLLECERFAVSKALKKKPGDRWACSTEFVDALRQDFQKSKLDTPHPTGKNRRFTSIRVIGIAAGLIVAAFLLNLLPLPRFSEPIDDGSKLTPNVQYTIPADDKPETSPAVTDSEKIIEQSPARKGPNLENKPDLGPKSIKNEAVTAENAQDFLADPK
jgi:serine/threonine protein kinase